MAARDRHDGRRRKLRDSIFYFRYEEESEREHRKFVGQ